MLDGLPSDITQKSDKHINQVKLTEQKTAEFIVPAPINLEVGTITKLGYGCSRVHPSRGRMLIFARTHVDVPSGNRYVQTVSDGKCMSRLSHTERSYIQTFVRSLDFHALFDVSRPCNFKRTAPPFVSSSSV